MRVLVESLHNIRRQILMSLSSILVIFLAVFCGGLLVSLVLFLGGLIKQMESQAQLSIFFNDSANEEQIKQARNILVKSSELISVNYISKQQALELYTSQYQHEPMLVESVSAEIFPASLDIRAKNLASLNSLSDFLSAGDLSQEQLLFFSSSLGLLETDVNSLSAVKPLIEEVAYYKDLASKVNYWLKVTRWAGLGLLGLLVGVSILVVLVTIGLSVRGSKEEISIMKLVGATDHYVQGPYLCQGSLLGFFGACLSLAASGALVPLFFSWLSPLWQELSWSAPAWWLIASLALGELVLGAGLGCLGSWIAVKRYSRA
ncbi:hypothetical protein COT52_01270 [candidate division WWE3 bacterium CG08_land_8_20_14_0_20_43_13]|uniref:Cell division protein FtsX n=1 Tax=candidate division WWE3 bacterium CG08_land_8_20_14_0_20_43_13 TaxID=1975087 RepID=A0A2H0X7M6_UNCKA|nr:MAG: hypothetical protein COT52_01270 [candidate division WWE3 bacterium CG08_land_8_20_14_0_20_43_13]